MTLGKCHLCCVFTDIRYCTVCLHWFCQTCRRKYWHRGIAAIKEMIHGSRKGCCGPNWSE